MRRELRRQRVRIGNLKVSIPTKCRLTAKVRDRVDVDLFTVDDLTECLEPNHRAIAAHNAEKLILRGWASEGNFKTQLIAIERERRGDVSDDKERCLSLIHISEPTRLLSI